MKTVYSEQRTVNNYPKAFSIFHFPFSIVEASATRSIVKSTSFVDKKPRRAIGEAFLFFDVSSLVN